MKQSLQAAAAVLVIALAVIAPNAGAQEQSGAQQSVQREAAPPSGSAENGARLYRSYGCYQCHGYAAHGGGGPKLGPDAISFPAFSRYTRQPTGSMPPYTTKVLSDRELADIYAFVRSVPKSPDSRSLPLLND